MAESNERVGEWIVAMAREHGFALCGIVPSAPSAYREHVTKWLASGNAGEMAYLDRNLEARLNPSVFVPGCRSLILVADQYHARAEPEPAVPAGHGRVARYARGRDYHTVMKHRLHALADAVWARFPAESFRSFVDTAPILEREHAARAGLGWIGKHTLLIHPRRGSWLFLGGIATSLAIEPPRTQRTIEDHCGTCTRCIDACPTAAITPYSVDARRCIAYLTIEHRSPIDPDLYAPTGEWLFGCDICQDVCPHNSPRDRIPVGSANPAYASERGSFDLLGVLGWTEDARRAAVTGTPMNRATLAMWKRNAIIAAGNLLRAENHSHLHARIAAIAGDTQEDDMVRETARTVLTALDQADAAS